MSHFEDGIFELGSREEMKESASYPGQYLEETVQQLSPQEIEVFWTPQPPADMDLEEMFDWYIAQEQEKGGVFNSASNTDL